MFWPSAGRPSLKSVDRAVDRCAQTCTALFGWRAGRPTRSTARELYYLDLARSTGRSTGRELLLSVSRPRSTGRSTGGITVGNQIVLLSWTPTTIFFRPIYWGYFGLFYIRFLESFQVSFTYLTKCFISTCFRAKTSISKGEFFKSVFKKEIS